MHHHPPLAAVNLRYALTGVPGLASQTAIPASAVHSMQVRTARAGLRVAPRLHGWSGGRTASSLRRLRASLW